MAKTPWSKATTEQKNILSNSLKALAMIAIPAYRERIKAQYKEG